MTVSDTGRGDADTEAPELVADALARLTTAGYRHRFDLQGDRLLCPDCGAGAHPADFVIEASVTVTDDVGAGLLLALECLLCGVKGVWHVTEIGAAEQAALTRLRDGRPRSTRAEDRHRSVR